MEYRTNLTTAPWETVDGSTLEATQPVVYFTDPNPLNSQERYYRSVLP